MTLRITLKVKFRIFGMTLGTVGPLTYDFPIPVESAAFAAVIADKVHFNDRGVNLNAEIVLNGGGP